jgi:inosine-uridine nucleoside N-ribohydrolase
MQSPNNAKSPPGIIFDSGMGYRPDDPLALAMLYNCDGKNEARVIALSVSVADLNAARLCAAITRFYRLTPAKDQDPLPVGLLSASKLRDARPMTASPMSRINAEGAAAYTHNIEKLSDTADPLPLMRNGLASQPDQSVTVIVTGPATNAARLLGLPGAKELIRRKAKLLVVAMGAYPEGPPDFSVRSDVAAARKLFAEWPTPIVAAGADVGTQIPFPAASIDRDFAWAPAHPVADAYRAYQAMPYDAPTGALAAALYAVRPAENYFRLSEPGKIETLDDGRTKFTPAAGGGRRYLIVDVEEKEKTLAAYVQMASAKPIPPPAPRRA